MAVSFIIISIIIYLTNLGIKKGLKPFFEQEKKEMPKLPNKSITLIIAAIVSVILSNQLLEKVLLFASNVSFEKADIIFNLDISYYMFIKPLIEAIINDIVKKGKLTLEEGKQIGDELRKTMKEKASIINDNNKKYLTKEEVLKIIAEYNFISRTEFDLLKERVVELEEEIKGIK